MRERSLVGTAVLRLIAIALAVSMFAGLARAATPAMPACSGKMEMPPASLLAKYGITMSAYMHMEMPGPSSCIPFFPTLKPSGWTVTASSSVHDHPAAALLGAQEDGYWQSARIGHGAGLPLTITVTLPTPETVSGLSYTPQSGLGQIGRFTVLLSTDGRRFSTKIAYGRWQSNANGKQVGWVPRLVRAVRLTVLSVSPASARSVAASMISLTGAHSDQTAAKRMSATAGTPAKAVLKMMERAQQAGPTSTNPSVVGKWGPTIGLPLVPVAAALLPGDRLLLWSADEDLSFDQGAAPPYTQTALLNLATGSVSSATVSNTAHNMFCPGVSILPNGDVVVTGGISNSQTSIYDPKTNTWTAGPELNVGRGYQGQTTLSDGQAFVLGGSWSGNLGGKVGEVFSPTGAWRELTNVPANPIYTNDAAGVYRQDNHGWFVATSDGNVFQAGPSAEMHWITTTGAGTITAAAQRGTAGDEMNGNAVLYDVDKILTVGGAPNYQDSNATNVANTVDISGGPGSPPQVTATSSMNYPRGYANSVALPNGQVFTVGGETYPFTFDDSTSVMYPELWSPTSGQWTGMAEQAEPRNYHSVAVLLPDGTVFSGGGGLCGTCSVNHPDGQIFYPPYLFNADGSLATRPTITTAPATAVTGQTISVTTGGPVQSFVLMRYDEATHTVDNDQRRIPLTIDSQNGNTYTTTIPSDPGIALPGPYMLFAVNAQGTPSVSATIMISTPAVSTPTDSYGQTVDSDGPALYWPLTDAAGSNAATDLSGNRDPGTYSSTGVSYRTPSPIEGPNGQGVTVNGGKIIASQPQHPPSSYAEEVWFQTTSTSGGLIMRYGDSPTGDAAANDRIVYMTSTGRIDFGVYNGSSVVIQSPHSFNDGNWHFLVAAQGTDGMHLYVDGHQVASNTVSTAQQGYFGYWQLGGAVPGGWADQPPGTFHGSFSDAAVFETELTPAQILAQANASGVDFGSQTSSLPAPWSDVDVGAATPAGSAAFAAGVFTVSGGGNDIWGTTDQFHDVFQSLSGDGTITARVTSQSDSSDWAKAGVMIKQSATAGSPYALLAVTPGNGLAFQYGFDSDVGGGSFAFPNAWLRLTRLGNTVTAFSSADGQVWTQVGSTTLAATDPVTIGLFVTSHDAGSLSTATFDHVSVTSGGSSGGSSLPAPWSDVDVGAATPAGSAAFAAGVFTVSGGGNDIWGTTDQFHDVFQSLSGDGTITARVTSQSDSSDWAKAGVMIKQSATAGSPYALLAVTPGNGLAFQYGFDSDVGGGSFAFPNAWLRLTRLGNTVTAFSSADGQVWTQVGSTTLAATDPVTIGLFVTSHDAGSLSTATFDHVSVTSGGSSGGSSLPAPWSDVDVGAATPAGSAAFAAGVFTVSGGGNDIWGTTDQFHDVFQSLSGDGTITARVTSQSDSSDWAKAGVMIKQSATAGSPYALLAVTPGNGLAFQYGFDSDVGGGSFAFPNAWLRLTRLGNTVTAFSSADGQVWTQVGSTTLAATDPVTIGLFVTSHNSGESSTATFDHVTVSSP